MASNKNALIRYKTLDSCFRNRFKNYSLDDLIEECSQALFEYEGKECFVGKRTIQLDIQTMRSEKLGYQAPIEVYDRKYYRYSDPNYSIFNISVTENDLKIMNDAIQILKQFKDFSMFQEFNGIVQKLENTLYATQQPSVIHLDKNEHLKGLAFIDPLYKAILERKVLTISYKSFKAREQTQFFFHPKLLKEYNNRWFLIGFRDENLLNLALDRIISIEKTDLPFTTKSLNPDVLFENIIGVSFAENAQIQQVIFSVKGVSVEYIKTKPFHHSQKILYKQQGEVFFSIEVQLNFELERLILGFGEAITIHEPPHLKQRVETILKRAVENYQNRNNNH